MVLLLSVGMIAGMTACSKANNENKPASPSASVSPSASGSSVLEPEPGAELTIWDSEGNDGGLWLKKVLPGFTEKYGVKVTYEPVAVDDVPSKIATEGPAKLGADVFNAVHDALGGLVSAGLVYPNDTLKADDLVLPAVQGTAYGGKQYGYPVAIETAGLYYNKDYVKEPPKTFDEVISFAKEFNGKGKYGFMMETSNFYFVNSLLSGYGGYVFGKDGTDKDDIGLNNEGAVQGAEFFRSLKSILPVNASDLKEDIKKGLFIEGKVAYNIDGPWNLQGYKDSKINFGVAPLPLLPNGKPPVTFSGVRAFYVNSYTPYPKAAKLLASYLTSEEMLMDRYLTIGQIPPYKELLAKPEVSGDPITAGFAAQIENSIAMPSIPQMGAIWEPAASALEEIWNKGSDPKTQLDRAVKSIKDAIALQKK
ncbi:maltose ABC transporter substrate-binding protein [Cohnella faecalis]|uniref:Maltodextrin-binding protein n=2 Tax=Cohnella faecalis TaxID=2315694 RepID=A0A398CRU1_9BACL|nr:maltose ABC transporter substrate-binding protein [Cohnella faecalis]